MNGSGSGGYEDVSRGGPDFGVDASSRTIFEGENVVTGALAGYHARERPSGPVETDEPELSTAMAAVLIEVAGNLENLVTKQDDMKALFEARIRSDEIQAKALERLHDQVRDYRAHSIRQEMQPLLRDLISCHDFASEESEQAGRGGRPPSAEETARAFGHLRQMIADVLAKYDVEPYRSPGPEFDGREQQCVRTVPTAIEADDKKVAAVGVIGFRIADQIVRKEQVTVYEYSGDAGPHRESPPAPEQP